MPNYILSLIFIKGLFWNFFDKINGGDDFLMKFSSCQDKDDVLYHFSKYRTYFLSLLITINSLLREFKKESKSFFKFL